MKNLFIALIILLLAGLSTTFICLNSYHKHRLAEIQSRASLQTAPDESNKDPDETKLELGRMKVASKTYGVKLRELHVEGRYLMYLPDSKYNHNNS